MLSKGSTSHHCRHPHLPHSQTRHSPPLAGCFPPLRLRRGLSPIVPRTVKHSAVHTEMSVKYCSMKQPRNLSSCRMSSARGSWPDASCSNTSPEFVWRTRETRRQRLPYQEDSSVFKSGDLKVNVLKLVEHRSGGVE